MASGLAMSRFSRGSSLLLPSLLPGKNDEAMEQKPLNDIRHHLHHLNSTQLNSTQPSVEPVWGGEWMVQDKLTINWPHHKHRLALHAARLAPTAPDGQMPPRTSCKDATPNVI
ncbi:hypothetical protein H9L39_01410 [Fusarium oxysporum f. sp. albedinis]|nr:hypothetical protein H9L39_01410 [Fusarium oxysporum f. sp. albedinis]